jgi:hypothetical protein
MKESHDLDDYFFFNQSVTNGREVKEGSKITGQYSWHRNIANG